MQIFENLLSKWKEITILLWGCLGSPLSLIIFNFRPLASNSSSLYLHSHGKRTLKSWRPIEFNFESDSRKWNEEVCWRKCLLTHMRPAVSSSKQTNSVFCMEWNRAAKTEKRTNEINAWPLTKRGIARDREMTKRWIGLLSKNNWSFVYHYWNRLRCEVHGSACGCTNAIDIEPIELKMMKVFDDGRWCHNDQSIATMTLHHRSPITSKSIYWCREHMTPARWMLLSRIKIKHFTLLSNGFSMNSLASKTFGQKRSDGWPLIPRFFVDIPHFWGHFGSPKILIKIIYSILRGKQFCAGTRACGSRSRASV